MKNLIKLKLACASKCTASMLLKSAVARGAKQQKVSGQSLRSVNKKDLMTPISGGYFLKPDLTIIISVVQDFFTSTGVPYTCSGIARSTRQIGDCPLMQDYNHFGNPITSFLSISPGVHLLTESVSPGTTYNSHHTFINGT